MPRKIIIDCDPGIDDSLALMLALSMQERIEVTGITIVAGNSPVEMGYENALKILKFTGRLDVPVFMGASRPLRRDYIDALDTHGSDGLGESFLPAVDPGEYVREEKTAVEFMGEILSSESVSVIALGPMTNLALLAQENPAAFDNIDELFSMGGCFRSFGNCSPVAEYNYWCDPDAARVVYNEMDRRGRLVYMAGLDVTRKALLTPNLLAYMKRLDPRVGEFVEKITGFYFDFHWEREHIIGCVINDPLVIACFADRMIWKGFESYVQIETEGISIGQSMVDSMNFYRHAPNAVILTEVDTVAFFRLFISRLLHIDEESLDLLPQLINTHSPSGN